MYCEAHHKIPVFKGCLDIIINDCNRNYRRMHIGICGAV